MLYSIRYICGFFFPERYGWRQQLAHLHTPHLHTEGMVQRGKADRMPRKSQPKAKNVNTEENTREVITVPPPPSLPPLLESRMQILCKLTEIICWLQSALCYFFQISSPPSHPRTSDPTNSDSMAGIIRISYANCMQISCGGAYELVFKPFTVLNQTVGNLFQLA